ncbi:hypothetical protein CTAYLR_001209 [Chrysophaeum taylorii]|uniref:AB hydrolase-1 domain-containing protein n=1 Tax=Chrysophaeum taylorii TaxID=2483200 RepID=A0AAD7XLE0_9STRA|nr:hypothetical protein CTAYLR_001209 [Chrysophaeum taylorii]
MSKKKRVEGEGKVVGSISQGHGQAAFSVSFWPGESESGADGSGKDEVASSPTARSSCRTVYHVACVGGNRVNVYEVDPGKAPRGIELRQSYLDEDEREVFYACCWSCGRRRQDGSRIAMLIVGGQQGIAKVIDCGNFEVNVALAGHGNSINDARAHPVDGALLLTASKDESVRLWNIRTGTCVAVFAGDRGHRDEVLSVDVHALGGVFCSAGMDNTVKVWRLDSPRVARAIRASHEAPNPDFRPFRTAFEQFPVFSTAHVHSNYVDCARWAGSLIFSKSTANRVILWTPDPARASRSPRPDATDAAHPAAKSDAVLVLRELELAGADIWFMRFGVDPKHELVAAGNKTGKVNVWRVDAETSSPALRISQHKCNTAVRQVDFSPDSKLLACCCDDASVWVFDQLNTNAALLTFNIYRKCPYEHVPFTELIPWTETILGRAPGRFVDTRHGRTHYVYYNRANTLPLVVLVHGSGNSLERWLPIAKALSAKGFRVLAYDLYDHGFSETSGTKYRVDSRGRHALNFTLDVLVQQFNDVLEALGIKSSFVFVGHAIGGAIGLDVAATSAARVKGLVLMDAVVYPPNRSNQMLTAASTLKVAHKAVNDPRHEENQRHFQMMHTLLEENPRYLAAVTSITKHCKGYATSLVNEFKTCCRDGTPILLVWGREDAVTSYDDCIKLQNIAEKLASSSVYERLLQRNR